MANWVINGGLLDQKEVDAMCMFFEKLKEESVQEGRAEKVIDMGLDEPCWDGMTLSGWMFQVIRMKDRGGRPMVGYAIWNDGG